MKEKVKIICWIVAIIVGIGGSMWMSYLVYNAFFVTKWFIDVSIFNTLLLVQLIIIIGFTLDACLGLFATIRYDSTEIKEEVELKNFEEQNKRHSEVEKEMSGETFGLLIMVSSLFWMIGFMFGEEVAIICVLWALLQSFIGYVIGMRGLFKTFEEEATKNE
jgi:hypothetical protein